MLAEVFTLHAVPLLAITVLVLAGMALMTSQAVVSVRNELDGIFTRMAFLMLLVGVLVGFGYGYLLIAAALWKDLSGH